MGYFSGIDMVPGNDFTSGLKYLGDSMDAVAARKERERIRAEQAERQRLDREEVARKTKISEDRERDWNQRNIKTFDQGQDDRRVKQVKDITGALYDGGRSQAAAMAAANPHGVGFEAGRDYQTPDMEKAKLQEPMSGPAAGVGHLLDGGLNPGENGTPISGPQQGLAAMLKGPTDPAAGAATAPTPDVDKFQGDVHQNMQAERDALVMPGGQKVFIDPEEKRRQEANIRFKKGQDLLATINPSMSQHDQNQLRATAASYMAGFGSTGQVTQGMQNQQIMEDKAGHTTSDIILKEAGALDRAKIAGARATTPKPPNVIQAENAFEQSNGRWMDQSGTKKLMVARDAANNVAAQFEKYQQDPTSVIDYNAALVSAARSIHVTGVLTEKDYQNTVGNTSGAFDRLLNEIQKQENGQPTADQAAILQKFIEGNQDNMRKRGALAVADHDMKFANNPQALRVPELYKSTRDALMSRFDITDDDVAAAAATMRGRRSQSAPAAAAPQAPGPTPAAGERTEVIDGVTYVHDGRGWKKKPL